MFGSPTFWRFLRYTRPYRRWIIGAIVSGLFKFSLALSLPTALGLATDYVFLEELPQQEKMSRLALILLMLVLAYALRSPATYLRSYWAEKAGHRTIFDIRRGLFRHIQCLSLSYHAKRRTGATISRLINDLNSAQGILDQGVVAMAMDAIFLLGVVVFLFFFDVRLALASLFTLPLYGAIFHYLNPRLRVAAREVQQEMEEMSGEATEKLSGLQVVLAFVREKTEEIGFFRRHRRYFTSVMKRTRLRVSLITVAEFLMGLGPIIVICYGGYRVITGDLSFGRLLLFYGYLSHLYLPTRRLADYSAVLQERLGAMDRVFEIFDTEPEVLDRPNAVPLRRPAGLVSFRNVSFSYNGSETVLEGVTFGVEPGQAVAIVGRSGAGKSSLVSLVPRFYDATGGSVCIDGRDVRELTLRSLRQNIGMVLQETILFSGTIRENILYGRHNAGEQEIRRAARMAHAEQFIEEMPRGFDTVIGERGVSLSGGQKQRISIARAFLRDPRILILDEATSNLDSGAEQVIQDALRELMQGRTTLVIAHRLSTIADCDFVAVLERGRLVQLGPHDDLISVRGPYRDLCEEQFGSIRLDALQRHAM